MIHLRKAHPRDTAAIFELEKTLFGLTAWNEETIQNEITGNHRQYFVLQSHENIVGYGGVLMLAGDADIQTIAVATEFQNQGLGRRLLKKLLITAIENESKNVFLEVREDNPLAIKMYEKIGFEKIGIREKYYQPEGINAIIMQLKITNITAELIHQTN